MDLATGDEKKLTRMGVMSWAPYFHPSGEYLIFASNREGFANFELFMVDAAGRHEPVRVTHTDGFDGLPVFSPDGNSLSWTSTRSANKSSQIFMAEWDHEHALSLLGLSKKAAKTPVASLVADISGTGTNIDVADVRLHVLRLASDEMEGRLTGTRGEKSPPHMWLRYSNSWDWNRATKEAIFNPSTLLPVCVWVQAIHYRSPSMQCQSWTRTGGLWPYRAVEWSNRLKWCLQVME